MRRRQSDSVRRRRLAIGGAIAGVAFAVGAAVGAGAGDDGEATVAAYARAWAHADWARMHAQLAATTRRRTDLIAFAQANRDALATATADERAVSTGRPKRVGEDRWRVPVAIRTRVFGTVRGAVLVPLVREGDSLKVAWTAQLVFPGLRRGEALSRETRLLERGALLARDKTVLAAGPQRSSPIPDVAGQVVGALGPAPPEQGARLEALGVPAGAPVGLTGLERIFDERLAGTPAGMLRAGSRTIARSAGRPGEDVRTTIAPDLVRASIAALAGRYGGSVTIDPRDGAVLAFAGAPFSLLQPPGSTFKIVTTAAALDAGVASTRSSFPFEERAVLSGVPLANAGGEICGGTLAQAFAESCNSVFAPLGAKLGARRLVAAAERFGFNADPPFPGVARSTIPAAGEIGDDLAVGSTAIGQGRVQATTLLMTRVAASVAAGGYAPRPTLDLATARAARPRGGERVMKPSTARTLERLMLDVVRTGTGRAAQIAGVPVAGKTGTAELRSREPGDTSTNPDETTAWFVAFAPAGKSRTPRACVGVVLPGQGAGGDVAAPVAREILVAALRRG